MRNWLRTVVILAVCYCGCRSVPPPAQEVVTRPPIAKKIPKVAVIHGERLVDNYFWLRNKNDPRVLNYLKAENAYTDWFMKPTAAFQEALYNEMLGRIQETDSTVPSRDGDYFYYSRTEQGKQHPIYCRKRGSVDAPEEITLDLNELGQNKEFIDLGAYEVSDDGTLLAYTIDVTGFRQYTLYIKDFQTGKLLSEQIPNVDSVAWTADNRTLFSVTEDAAKRPYRLFRHTLDSPTGELLYEETDQMFELEVYRSRSKSFVFAASGSKTADQVRYLPADRPTDALRIVAPRQTDLAYEVDHRGDFFYIRTNDKGRKFRIVTAPVADPGRNNWKELVPHREDVMIDGLELFADQYVLLERENGLPNCESPTLPVARLTAWNFRSQLTRSLPNTTPSLTPECSASATSLSPLLFPCSTTT